ncbi:MAG: hypothetical protein AAGG75_16980 [Bacteroidota bacterium]
MDNNQHIKQLIERYQSQELARHHLEKVYERLEAANLQLEQLEVLLEKEYKSIKPLEQRSLQGLFHTILGNKESQLEIRKQEYLHMALKYNEHKKMVELLDFERRVLEEKLLDAAAVKQELEASIQQRSQSIIQRYPELANELNNVDREIDHKVGLRRELNEAIIVGLQAVRLLEEMADLLQQVHNWGASTHSAYRKEDSYELEQTNVIIDKAHNLLYKAQQILLKFDDELKDIYAYQRIHSFHRYDNLEHFSDIYYSRLISDWIVQKRIRGALANVRGTRDGVRQIIESLRNEMKQAEQSINYFEQRKKAAIMEYVKNK